MLDLKPGTKLAVACLILLGTISVSSTTDPAGGCLHKMLDSIYDPIIVFFHLTTIYAKDLAVNIEIIRKKNFIKFLQGKKALVWGKVQNMDPWSMDPLRGPGPWTPYFYYPYNY